VLSSSPNYSEYYYIPFFDWLLRRIEFLNLDNESDFLIAMSSLFHSLTVGGINDELVIESLQKGTIKLSPFRKWYIVVDLNSQTLLLWPKKVKRDPNTN
jgi:hypothetical protein